MTSAFCLEFIKFSSGLRLRYTRTSQDIDIRLKHIRGRSTRLFPHQVRWRLYGKVLLASNFSSNNSTLKRNDPSTINFSQKMFSEVKALLRIRLLCCCLVWANVGRLLLRRIFDSFTVLSSLSTATEFILLAVYYLLASTKITN